ncbi:MAG: hypothetical protein KDA61_15505 [Planctomycetales bacterium]|nr:hypothetical protein [Planctomycetales bacterium]
MIETQIISAAPGRGLGRRLAAGLALIVVSFSLAGCERSDPNKGYLSGQITINGAPAASGAIVFIPVDGMASTAGGTIADGRYAVVAPVGMARVEIRVPKVVGERKLYNTPDSPVQPLMEESLPARFNDDSELTFQVEPGDAEHDFTLEFQ